MYNKCLRFFNKKCVSSTQFRALSVSNGHTNIVSSDSSEVDIPNVTLPEFILPKLEKYEKYTANECAISGRSYTFGQVRSKCNSFSKSLRHIFKLKKGEVVAILLPNLPEYLIASLGILEAGLVLTTLNPIYTPHEISRQLLDSSTRVLITQANSVNTALTAIKLMKKDVPIVAVKSSQNDSLPQGIIDFAELVNANFDIPEADYGNCSDVAFLPYSSGTTGLPKGVRLSHRNIVANICQMMHEDYNYYESPTDSYQEVTPAVLPFYHIYGFTITQMHLAYNGSKAVTLDKFSPDLYISVLKKHPVSIIYSAPPLVLFLASHPDVKSEYLQRLKMMTSGAAPLGALDEERMLNKIGRAAKIIQAYGMTEASPVVTYTPRYIQRSAETSGCVGTAIPNTMIKVVPPENLTGEPLGPMEKGEILVKGPQVMAGYHNREEETKNTLLDGWLRTGDLGYYDKTKLLFITDRLKELIKVKGYQVAPAELEEIIRDHPAVEDAAVIGIPHPKHGEVPRAYIVPKKNVTLDLDGLKKHFAGKVAKYKQLDGGVKILESIPKNPSGKILRRQLKNDYEEKGI